MELTKVERKTAVREIIAKYKVGDAFSVEDVRRVSELCGYVFQAIARIKPHYGNAPSISVACIDEGYTGPWSWIKSIDGYDERQNVIQALRQASRRGILSTIEKDRCAFCGATESLGVDHKTIPFIAIAGKFISMTGMPAIVNHGRGWQLVDEAAFIGFHDAIADFQVLCVRCNSKKGGRAHVETA